MAAASLVAAAVVVLDLTALFGLSRLRVAALVSAKGALALAAEVAVELAAQMALLAVAEIVAARAFAFAMLETVHAVVAKVGEVACALVVLEIVLAVGLTGPVATVLLAVVVIDLIVDVVRGVVEAGSVVDLIDPVETVLIEKAGAVLAAVAFDPVAGEGLAELEVGHAFVAIDRVGVSGAAIFGAGASAFEVLVFVLAVAAVDLLAVALLAALAASAIGLAEAQAIALARVASDSVVAFEVACTVAGVSAIEAIVIAVVVNFG